MLQGDWQHSGGLSVKTVKMNTCVTDCTFTRFFHFKVNPLKITGMEISTLIHKLIEKIKWR